ncbi:MAG: FAD-binding protein [Luteitalea sp.]|nr:FAD-binding protein [Luteitalea sp.]
MILDARELADSAVLTADVCIAGGGAAGLTLGLSLRNKGLTVCILESGGYEPDNAVQALYQGTMSGIKTWELDKCRMRLLGGTTYHWEGLCRPFVPEDFTARAYIPGSGWPVTYEDIVPFYRRAHRTLGLGGFDYDARALSERLQFPLLLADSDVVEPRFYQLSPPVRFGTRYRTDLNEAPDVHVYLHANVVDIRLTAAGGPVSHFECKTLEGTSFRVEAQRYVLALGGLENARVLLASNAQQSEGIANGSGRVGYFLEHPHYYRCIALLTKPSDLRFYRRNRVDIPVDGQSQLVDVYGGFGLSAAVRAGAGLPDFTATLEPAALEEADTGRLPAKTMQALTVSGAGRPELLRLSLQTEQTPTPESRMTLGNEVDALGMPRIDLHWTIRSDDNEALCRAAELLGVELGRAGLGRAWVPLQDQRFAWIRNAGCHHMGTTSMSADASLGVVNARCQAHDVENLYIAGSSVFVTGGACNPTLSIVALAHRLADHLEETF